MRLTEAAGEQAAVLGLAEACSLLACLRHLKWVVAEVNILSEASGHWTMLVAERVQERAGEASSFLAT